MEGVPSGNLRPEPEPEDASPEEPEDDASEVGPLPFARPGVRGCIAQGAPHKYEMTVPPMHEMNAIINIEIPLFFHGMLHRTATKTVQVIPQAMESFWVVDRSCLFAFDEVSAKKTDGGWFTLPLRAQQTVGKKCPCCGKTVTESASQQ